MARAFQRLAIGFWALVLGAASLTVLLEQDIYWQIRAGDDLWRTGQFPWTDTWSFSAPGAPWLNIQWLATLLFRGIYGLGQETALVAARGLGVAALFALLSVIVCRAKPTAPGTYQGLVLSALLPLLAVALWPRLQLRPDLLVMLVFAGVVLLPATKLPPTRRRVFYLGAVWLSANLQASLTPFVLLAAAALAYDAAASWRQNLAWLAAMAAAFFCTPYGWHGLPILWDDLIAAPSSLIASVDHAPLSQEYLISAEYNGAGLAWLVWLACTLVGIALSRPWVRRPWLHYAVALGLTALAIHRVRAIPYQVIWMLPWLPEALGQRKTAPQRWLAALACASLTLWLMCTSRMVPLWGFGAHEGLFPVHSARFIAAQQPQGPILHTEVMGAYIVWALPTYRLYTDPRQTPYAALQREFSQTFMSTADVHKTAHAYGVNALLLPAPLAHLVEPLQIDGWALVSFDNASSVLLRQTPTNAPIIARYAYSYLRPHFAMARYAAAATRTPESDKILGNEVRRCLEDNPDNVTCLASAAALVQLNRPGDYPTAGQPLRERAEYLAWRWGISF